MFMPNGFCLLHSCWVVWLLFFHSGTHPHQSFFRSPITTPPPPPPTHSLPTHTSLSHSLPLRDPGRRRCLQEGVDGDVCHESLPGDPWHSGVPLLCMQGMLARCTPALNERGHSFKCRQHNLMKVWRTAGVWTKKGDLDERDLSAVPSRGGENWRSGGFYELFSPLFFHARCAQLHFGAVETFAGSHKDLALWHTLSLNMHVGPIPAEYIMTKWIGKKNLSFFPPFFLFSFFLPPFLPPSSHFSLLPLLTPALSSLLFFSLAPSTFPHGWVWQGHGFKDVRAPECRSAIGAELPIRNSCAFVGRFCSVCRGQKPLQSSPVLELLHFAELSALKSMNNGTAQALWPS